MKRNGSHSNQTIGRRSEQTRAGPWTAATGIATASNKRRKLHEGKSPDHNKQRDDKPKDLAGVEADFPKLDQANPEHARRIQQRRRMVAFGKNTVGYDEYLKKVPKSDRRPRCMKHPSTPDHTLDIPTKRWQGLIKAWRRALHQYDPPDMMKALNDEAPQMDVDDDNVAVETTVVGRQIAEAAAKGLPVVIQDSLDSPVNKKISSSSSPSSLATFVSSDASGFGKQAEIEDLDVWEQRRGEDEHLLDDDDSDDDLL